MSQIGYRKQCNNSKKIIETIDFSNNNLKKSFLDSFFECLRTNELYIKGNNFKKVPWQITDKSLRILDLQFNKIEQLMVSPLKEH